MLKAKDVLSPIGSMIDVAPTRNVSGEMPLIDVLPRLLDSPGRLIGVEDAGEVKGVIDQTSLLEGLGRMLSPRDDSSLVTVECFPEDYSASRLAHAVEDSDAHLVDLWSVPSDDGKVRVTMRVRRLDPSATVHSLERYGYDVVDASGSEYQDATVSLERLMELNRLLSV